MDGEICGKKYRRTMYEAPGSRTCTKPPHEGGRHSDSGPKRESDSPSGTCQICFRSQKARSGLLVLHGYKRPGYGYIVGNCWGCGYAPFEVSCERTKQFLAEVLRPTLARFEANLSRLQAKPESIDHETRVFVGYQAAPKSGYDSFTAKIAKGSPSALVESTLKIVGRPTGGQDHERREFERLNGRPPAEGFHLARVPSYDSVLVSAIHEQESRIQMCKADIASFEQKVRAWKPVPWPAIEAVTA